MRIRIVGVDIGSVKRPSKFAWAALDAPGPEVVASGDDPELAVAALVAGLDDGRQAALLLEAPTSVPVPDTGPGWRFLGKARAGEGNRPWSAGAGAGALATGLAQGAWLLGHLAASRPGTTATSQADVWRRGGARLLLAEAFVSGSGKPVALRADQHAADAAAVGREMVARLGGGDELASDVRCAPQGSFNLLAAMAQWAGLDLDADELRKDVLVIRVHPVLRTT